MDSKKKRSLKDLAFASNKENMNLNGFPKIFNF